MNSISDCPPIVCLCGSTRFREIFEKVMREETLAGRIVLSVGLFGHLEGLDMGGPLKAFLDELHLRKIDRADEVFVINPLVRLCPKCGTIHRHDFIRVGRCSCGTEIGDVEPAPYLGASTRREIAYARSKGKPIRWLEALPPEWAHAPDSA